MQNNAGNTAATDKSDKKRRYLSTPQREQEEAGLRQYNKSGTSKPSISIVP